MSKKVDRALHGPSWTEVILGAVLALLLGGALGAVLLILRPVVEVREEPKERASKTVYYIPGSNNAAKAREALAKRKAFVEGQSVTVVEDEINALLAASAASEKAKAGQQGKAATPADKSAPAGNASSDYIAAGVPNVRIREGVLQVGVPVTIDLLGKKVIAQASGGFVKQGDIFVYEPETLHLGSCPVQRLPFLSGFVRSKFLAGQSIPEDIKTAWTKLANVTIEGNAVKLTMP